MRAALLSFLVLVSCVAPLAAGSLDAPTGKKYSVVGSVRQVLDRIGLRVICEPSKRIGLPNAVGEILLTGFPGEKSVVDGMLVDCVALEIGIYKNPYGATVKEMRFVSGRVQDRR